MTTREMRPLHEMYGQDEIKQATATVMRAYIDSLDVIERNPVLPDWASFTGGYDLLELCIGPAIRAVLARRWHAVNGPQDPDLQQLPLGYHEREATKREGCAGRILAWYARSLAHNDYDIQKHPSFYEYACGVLAQKVGGSVLFEQLKHRFPPRLLPGLDKSSGDWDPPPTEQDDGGSR
jgi:hypothetical protein